MGVDATLVAVGSLLVLLVLVVGAGVLCFVALRRHADFELEIGMPSSKLRFRLTHRQPGQASVKSSSEIVSTDRRSV
jgi:hypothetical protein